MEATLTFGSIGDIIAVCQLAVQLGKVLGVGAASSAGIYEALRKDLDTFVQVLMHVIAAHEQYDQSPALGSLAHVTQTVVAECGTLIKETLDRVVPRYHDSLQSGGSGQKLKDSYKKVKFWASETDRLAELQANLSKNTMRLSMLTVLAARRSSQSESASIIARIEEIRQIVENQEEYQQSLVTLVKNQESVALEQTKQLVQINDRLDRQEQPNATLFAYVNQACSAIIEVKSMLTSIAENVLSLHVALSNSIYIRPLDPTKGMPIIFEDSLGFQRELPLDWVDDWESLNMLVEALFRKRKGHELVLRRQFALEENSTGRDLDQSKPLTASLRRGMKINMSMIFTEDEPLRGSCPRCKTVTDAVEDTTIQCRNKQCAMWFRVKDIAIESNQGALDNFEVNEDFDDERTETVMRSHHASIHAEPSDFQRVRLLAIIHDFDQDIDFQHQRDAADELVVTTKDLLQQDELAYFKANTLNRDTAQWERMSPRFVPTGPRPRLSPMAPDADGNEIPLDSYWTRINRKLVTPEILQKMQMRYEARPEYVAVLGVFSKEEIARLARMSTVMRTARKAKHEPSS